MADSCFGLVNSQFNVQHKAKYDLGKRTSCLVYKGWNYVSPLKLLCSMCLFQQEASADKSEGEHTKDILFFMRDEKSMTDLRSVSKITFQSWNRQFI